MYFVTFIPNISYLVVVEVELWDIRNIFCRIFKVNFKKNNELCLGCSISKRGGCFSL